MNKTIGEKIRAARHALGESLKTVAERLDGYDKGNLSKLECDLTNPTMATLRKVAAALGCELVIEFEPMESEK